MPSGPVIVAIHLNIFSPSGNADIFFSELIWKSKSNLFLQKHNTGLVCFKKKTLPTDTDYFIFELIKLKHTQIKKLKLQ